MITFWSPLSHREIVLGVEVSQKNVKKSWGGTVSTSTPKRALDTYVKIMFKLALSNLANCYLVIRVLNCQIQATSVKVFFWQIWTLSLLFLDFFGFHRWGRRSFCQRQVGWWGEGSSAHFVLKRSGDPQSLKKLLSVSRGDALELNLGVTPMERFSQTYFESSPPFLVLLQEAPQVKALMHFFVCFSVSLYF